MTPLSRPRRAAAVLATVAALAALAACSESPVAPDAATPSAERPLAALTAATTPTTYTVTTCAGTSITLSADEKRSLDLHNAQRSAYRLVPFCVDAKLTTAARAHSQEMIDRGYFSHNSYDGTSFAVRLGQFGYTGWTALAENIAWGSGSYGDPDRIFTGWMNSAGHRANILNGNLRQIGIGVASGTYLTYAGARMYTADFGTR